MSQAPQVFVENYKIASYLVNLKNKAGLYSILNLIQDVGWVHGISLRVQLPKNQNWVFTRQKLVMDDWPSWNDTLTIRTWIRPPSGPFILRDYELFLGDRKIGEATSTFAIMDLGLRKIVEADWSAYQSIWRQEGHLKHLPAKIVLNQPLVEAAQFHVRNSDLDMNQHVNNTKYAQWVLDSVPIGVIQANLMIREYEVNFLAESKSGDLIQVQKSSDSPLSSPTTFAQFQGVRTSDGKPVFLAELKVSQAVSS